jgi:hypothetical protein
MSDTLDSSPAAPPDDTPPTAEAAVPITPVPVTLVRSFTTGDNSARRRLSRWLKLGALGVVTVAIIALITGGLGRATPEGMRGLFTALSCVGFLTILISFALILITLPYALHPGNTLDLHTDGFILRSLKTQQPQYAALWSQVTDIVQPVQRQVDGMGGAGAAAGLVGIFAMSAFGAVLNEAGRTKHETNAIIVTPQRKIRLDALWKNLDELTRTARTLARDAWEAEALASITAGGKAALGYVVADAKGITARKTFIPWDQIRTVSWYHTGQQKALMIQYDQAGKKQRQSLTITLGTRGEVLVGLIERYSPALTIPAMNTSSA